MLATFLGPRPPKNSPRSVGLLVGCLAVWLVGCLVGWLPGWFSLGNIVFFCDKHCISVGKVGFSMKIIVFPYEKIVYQ